MYLKVMYAIVSDIKKKTLRIYDLKYCQQMVNQVLVAVVSSICVHIHYNAAGLT